MTEETGGTYEPVVTLAPVAVDDGETDEEVIYKEKSVLYRFEKKDNEWKERGRGNASHLSHSAPYCRTALGSF